MCGIVGAISLSGDGLPWKREEVLEAARFLRHRGPDEQTAWADPSGHCLLGHARLRVIDLETGHQPMGNSAGTVQVVFNGEIYNFPQLRTELEGRGYRFRTRSDTEVLVHGWDAWGEDVVGRLDGMFAFGIWDGRKKSLLLARDRVGKKPLFFLRNRDWLVFGSEIKALLALPGIQPSLDPLAFPLYLSFGYVPAPNTFFEGVEKLPPAHLLRAKTGSFAADTCRFWKVSFQPRTIPRQEAVAEIRSLLRSAVQKRLVSDVPLGAFLSGGVDSTIVVGQMARLLDRQLRTFSIGFSGQPNYDETNFARLAAERFQTDHTAFKVDPTVIEEMGDLVSAYDEPFGDSSAIPMWVVSRLARADVTVALTGDGGDELFAGYPRFFGMLAAEMVPGPVAAIGRFLSGFLPTHHNFRHPTRRAKRFFEAARLSPEERWLQWIGYFRSDPVSSLRESVRETVLSRMDGPEGLRRFLLSSLSIPWKEAGGLGVVKRSLSLNFHSYLPEDLLVKSDRTSMGHGLELRSPFLDRELIEFAATIPSSMLTPRFRLKGLLKDSFPELLPVEISKRPKMGFGVPLPAWFRSHWRPFTEETLFGSDSRIGDWLDPLGIRRIAEDHWSGRADRAHDLWTLLSLEMWLRMRS